jgi:hypothetical protein
MLREDPFIGLYLFFLLNKKEIGRCIAVLVTLRLLLPAII